MREIAAQHVEKQKRARVPEVRLRGGRQAAYVDAHLASRNGTNSSTRRVRVLYSRSGTF